MGKARNSSSSARQTCPALCSQHYTVYTSTPKIAVNFQRYRDHEGISLIAEMSTIASPRPSIALSSRRNSNSTDTTNASTSNRAAATTTTTDTPNRTSRRNRAALRDYYGLKAAEGRDPSASPSIDAEPTSELDQPDFDPQGYVQHLLAHAGLEGILRVAAGLVADIRALDGEKKALVYDNYSKLIAATDTIRRMRERMDPLTPTTSTLTPAIAQIAATAAELAATLREHGRGEGLEEQEEVEKRRRERRTVRWVLAAPERIGRQVGDGEIEAAKLDWKEVSVLLDQWHGVKGTEEVRRACLEALDGAEGG